MDNENPKLVSFDSDFEKLKPIIQEHIQEKLEEARNRGYRDGLELALSFHKGGKTKAEIKNILENLCRK